MSILERLGCLVGGMAVAVLKTRVLNGLLIRVKGVPWPHLEGPELLRRMDQKKKHNPSNSFIGDFGSLFHVCLIWIHVTYY